MPSTYLPAKDFCDYVASRGYRTEPVLTNTTADRFGIVGYRLIGPRGNKKIVGKNADGLLPLFDAQLWCDGVDCATSRLRGRS
jgi:hypothetical protein